MRLSVKKVIESTNPLYTYIYIWIILPTYFFLPTHIDPNFSWYKLYVYIINYVHSNVKSSNRKKRKIIILSFNKRVKILFLWKTKGIINMKIIYHKAKNNHSDYRVTKSREMKFNWKYFFRVSFSLSLFKWVDDQD